MQHCHFRTLCHLKDVTVPIACLTIKERQRLTSKRLKASTREKNVKAVCKNHALLLTIIDMAEIVYFGRHACVAVFGCSIDLCI